MCNDGMFWCAFDLVFGIGAAVLALIFVASLMGVTWGKEE